MDPANVALTRNLVKPPARAFLDARYQHWYETCAINYEIDQSFPLGDHSELDELWVEFGETLTWPNTASVAKGPSGTASFFTQRGLSLYNLPVGQRRPLRSRLRRLCFPLFALKVIRHEHRFS